MGLRAAGDGPFRPRRPHRRPAAADRAADARRCAASRTHSSVQAGPSARRATTAVAGSWSFPASRTPSTTRGRISSRASSGSSSSRKASKHAASSSGASHIGTWPHWRRTSRDRGRARCHSSAILIGISRSRSPQTRSDGARTAASSARRSRSETNTTPRRRSSGPARTASPTIVGSRSARRRASRADARLASQAARARRGSRPER